MAEREEELKSLFMKVKEESEKTGLRQHSKKKVMSSGLIISWQIDGGNNENSEILYFLGLQNPCGQWLQPWKENLLVGRKAMANQDIILKSRDITLLTKVHPVKAMVFPVVMCECETWTIKKAEHRRIDAFKCGAGEESWESVGQKGGQTS